MKREKKIPHPLERWAPHPPDIAADRVAAPAERIWAGGAIDMECASPEWIAALVLAYTSPDFRAALVAAVEEEME